MHGNYTRLTTNSKHRRYKRHYEERDKDFARQQERERSLDGENVVTRELNSYIQEEQSAEFCYVLDSL